MYKSINCEITFFLFFCPLYIIFFLHTKSIWASLCEEGVPLNKLLAKFALKINMKPKWTLFTFLKEQFKKTKNNSVCFRFDVLRKDSSAQTCLKSPQIFSSSTEKICMQ